MGTFAALAVRLHRRTSVAPFSQKPKPALDDSIFFLESLYKFRGNGVYELKIVNKESSGWYEAFYEVKAAALILYGRALGLSHGEAEDVLHETFLALMQRQELPREPENYCLRSFRNRALNYKRSLWRRFTRELESRRWFETRPDETAAERAAMQRLASLPPEQREVIVLKIWNQCTFEQIGALLDISPNTAAGRYRYGLQKIKSQLQETNYERDEPVGDAIALLAAAPAISPA